MYSPLSADEPTKLSAVMYGNGFAQCGNGCVCACVRVSFQQLYWYYRGSGPGASCGFNAPHEPWRARAKACCLHIHADASVSLQRGPRRKPVAILYTRKCLSLSLSHGGQGESLVPPYTRGSVSLSLSLLDLSTCTALPLARLRRSRRRWPGAGWRSPRPAQ